MRSAKVLRTKNRKEMIQHKENIHPNIQITKPLSSAKYQKEPTHTMQHQPSTRTATYRPEADLAITEQLSQVSPPQAPSKVALSSLDVIPRCYSQNRTRHRKQNLTSAAHSQRSKLEEHVQKMLSNQKLKEQLMFKQTNQKNYVEDANYRNVFISQFEKYYNLSRELKSAGNKTEKEATLSKYIAEKSPTMEDKEEDIILQELTQIVNIVDLMFIPKSDRSTSKHEDMSHKPVLNLVFKIKHKLQEAYRQRVQPTYRKATIEMFEV